MNFFTKDPNTKKKFCKGQVAGEGGTSVSEFF